MVKRLIGRGLTSGRVDDNEETIKLRLNTFHSHTKPILNHYSSKVVKINAERNPTVIFEEVSQCLNTLVLHDKSHLM
jgi:adenylate kinase